MFYNYTESLTEKVDLWIFSPVKKKPQINISRFNFSVQNSYFKICSYRKYEGNVNVEGKQKLITRDS